MGKAKLWAPPSEGVASIELRDELDYYLGLYKLTGNPDEEDVQEILIAIDNLSSGDLTYYLDNGNYRVEIGVYHSFLVYDTDEEEGEIHRYQKYEFSVYKQKRYTLYDVIKRIRDIVPIEKSSIHEETRLFHIDEEMEERLDKIEAPQLFMTRLTAREAINNALKYVNAISRLVKDPENTLRATFFNERTGTYVHKLDDVFTIDKSQDAHQYGLVSRSFLRNTINTNDVDNPSVVELADKFFKAIRSETYQVLPETGRLTLQYPIFRLLSLKARIKVKRQYRNIYALSGWDEEDVQEITLDLFPYIVEKNILELSDPTKDIFGTSVPLRDFNREHTRNRRIELAEYKYGDNYIDFAGTVGRFYPRTKLHRIIESALAERLYYDQGKRKDNTDAIYVQNKVDASAHDIVGGDGSPISLSDESIIKEMTFNVSYIALEDNVHDAHKEDTSIIDKYTENISNVNDRLINFERASVGNYGISQRLGVPTITYGRITGQDKVEEEGFVNQNNEVVVEAETIYYPDHKIHVYEASRDFNRLAKFVSVDREYRPYEIPQSTQNIKRNDVYTEFLEYSTHKEKPEPRPNDTFVRVRTIETILNTILSDETKNKELVKAVLVRTDGMLESLESEEKNGEYVRNAVIVPVLVNTGKNTLSFKFGFDSPISAGDRLVEYDTDGLSFLRENIREMWKNFRDFLSEDEEYYTSPYGVWRRFVPYTDRNGFFDKLHFSFLTGLLEPLDYGDDGYFEETRNFPLIQFNSQNPEQYFNNQETFKAFESGNGVSMDDALVVKKDASEVYAMTYQIATVPASIKDGENLVIGKKFMTNNYIGTPFEKREMYLYLHSKKRHYTLFDDKEKQIETYDKKVPIQEAVEIFYDGLRPIGYHITENMNNYENWAIGDKDGNIYLASNTNDSYVMFEPRNKRTTIDYDW